MKVKHFFMAIVAVLLMGTMVAGVNSEGSDNVKGASTHTSWWGQCKGYGGVIVTQAQRSLAWCRDKMVGMKNWVVASVRNAPHVGADLGIDTIEDSEQDYSPTPKDVLTKAREEQARIKAEQERLAKLSKEKNRSECHKASTSPTNKKKD